jgi:hypothetical protein
MDFATEEQLRSWIRQTLAGFDKPGLAYDVCVGVAKLHRIEWPAQSYMKTVSIFLDRMVEEGTVIASLRSVMRKGGTGLSTYHYELNILDRLTCESSEGTSG